MNDPTRRALRTGLQVFVGWIVAGGLAAVVNAYADQWQIDGANRLALTMLLTIVLSWAQNYAEEQGALPPVLKGPKPPAAS